MASTLSSAVTMTTSSMTAVTARREVSRTEGRSGVAPASSCITPVLLAAASTPESARIMPTNATQLCHTPPVGELRMEVLQVRHAAHDQDNHDTNTGIASQMAMLPVCLGPKKFIAPMRKIAAIAHLLACTGRSPGSGRRPGSSTRR